MRALLLGLLVSLALPSFALEVTQGESVTLHLKITNSGEVSTYKYSNRIDFMFLGD